MKHLDDMSWQKIRAKAPEHLYDKVRQRIVVERVRRVQNARQLAVGAVLLLLIAAVNVSLAILNRPPKRSSDTEETLLYKTYFDSSLNFDDEK